LFAKLTGMSQKFCVSLSVSHVYMWWLATLDAEEEKPVTANPQQGGPQFTAIGARGKDHYFISNPCQLANPSWKIKYNNNSVDSKNDDQAQSTPTGKLPINFS
jgi:hypothetical protein